MKVGDTVVRKQEDRDMHWLRDCKEAGIGPNHELKVSNIDVFISLDKLSKQYDKDKFYLVRVASVNDASTRCLCCDEDDRYPCTCGGRDKPKPSNAVTSPAHYQFFPDLEAIEVIASSLTAAEFRGYCLGNRLKYRLRAGNKDKLEQDIKKSDYYVELYEKHKHLCKAS